MQSSSILGAILRKFLEFSVGVWRFYKTKRFAVFRNFRVNSKRFSYVNLCAVYTNFCAVLRNSYPLTPGSPLLGNEEYLPKLFFLLNSKLYLKWSKCFCNFTAWVRIETTGFHNIQVAQVWEMSVDTVALLGKKNCFRNLCLWTNNG